MKPSTRRRWKIAGLTVLAVLIAIRIALPIVMQKQLNDFLGGYSQIWSAHIGDIDLSFIRMAYRMENIEAKLKKGDQRFVKVGAVDVSLAWRELLRGRILTDIDITAAEIDTAPNLIPALKQAKAEAEAKSKKEPEEPSVKSKLFPIRIERIVVRDSSFEFAPEKNAPEAQRFRVTDIQSRVSNVSPLAKTTKTMATFQGTVMDSAKVKAVAEAKVSEKKVDWDVDMEMRHFNLAKANPFLKKMVPFTFTSGTLDMFSEAKMEDGVIVGYVKPFLRKVDVIKSDEHFANSTQAVAEIVSAIGNVILQRKSTKTLATKVDFTMKDGKFSVDAPGALANAVEHALDDELAPSVEDEIKLK